MPIDPALVAALVELGVPMPPESADIVEQRKLALEYEQAVYPRLGLSAPELPVRDHLVPVDGHPDVRVRVFRPSETDTPLPVCLFFFGGAWQQGGLHHPSVAATCALRAVRADVVVAAVDYALAPEHPYPAAVEQASAALDWLVREAGALGVDPTRIAVAGQSSGANLAAALTHVNRERADHPIALQILEVPCVDLTMAHLDRTAAELTDEQWASLAGMLARYAPRAEDRLRPSASPLLAASFAGLPPAHIVTAEVDPLRGDGEAYAAALAADGVPVAAIRLVGATHESGVYERVSATARAAQAGIAYALRGLHR